MEFLAGHEQDGGLKEIVNTRIFSFNGLPVQFHVPVFLQAACQKIERPGGACPNYRNRSRICQLQSDVYLWPETELPKRLRRSDRFPHVRFVWSNRLRDHPGFFHFKS